MPGPTTSFSNWDFYNQHVHEDVSGGQFVSAESTLIAAGPPRLDMSGANITVPASVTTSTDFVYPIGLLETVGLQQSKQLQRIFEIGSTRSYFIPGRTIGTLNIGRTFYFGPSLLRVLYAYYRTANAGDPLLSVGDGAVGGQVTDELGFSRPDPQAGLLGAVTDTGVLHKLRRSPGEGYMLLDLASDLFSQPTGMAIYFKDYNSVTLGAMYLEDCYVQGHQMTISSGSVLIMEGASLQYDRMRPIKVG